MNRLSLFSRETVLCDAKVLGGCYDERISIVQKGGKYIVRQTGCSDYETKDRDMAFSRFDSRAKVGTIENY